MLSLGPPPLRGGTALPRFAAPPGPIPFYKLQKRAPSQGLFLFAIYSVYSSAMPPLSSSEASSEASSGAVNGSSAGAGASIPCSSRALW